MPWKVQTETNAETKELMEKLDQHDWIGVPKNIEGTINVRFFTLRTDPSVVEFHMSSYVEEEEFSFYSVDRDFLHLFISVNERTNKVDNTQWTWWNLWRSKSRLHMTNS